MKAGAHISHAARLAFDAHRAQLASIIHLEAAGLDPLEEPFITDLLFDHAVLAEALQLVSDNHGSACARTASTNSDRCA